MSDTQDEQAGTKVVHLRLPAELHDRLSAFANETRRSKTGAAVVLLEDALDRHETERARK